MDTTLVPQVQFGKSLYNLEYKSYDTWKLIPTSSILIALPSQKVQTIDIPGRNGAIDISNSFKIGGGPLFNNREGSFDFVLPTQDLLGITDWKQYVNIKYSTYNQIVNTLHGRLMYVKSDKDGGTYYGRFEVQTLSDDGKSPSKLSIKYSLEPEPISFIGGGEWSVI